MIVFGPSVHTLKVSLREVEPTVWRRIVVPSETKLATIARWLEAAMGWEGYHLHSFSVGGLQFGPPDEDVDDVIDERRVTLKEILPRTDSTLRWDYDFGDGWEHDVVVEAIEEPSTGVRYPVCVDGAQACPPEDCGGPGGFAGLLAAIADPTLPEHEHLRVGVPAGFDAGRFDIDAANRRMQARR